MKKILALALTAALAVSMVACGSSEPEAPAVTYKTGVGSVITVKGTDATEEKGASAQVDTVIVAATFDNEGKVVSATIDTAQNKAAFDLEGKLAGEVDTRTKVEKGDDYGMRGVSAIGKEVNEQFAALEEYWVGKTVEEISAMPTYKRDDNHTAVPDVEELKASCTISVGAYIQALEKAYANAVDAAAPVVKTGLGVVVSPSISEKTEEKGPSAQMNTSFIVVALDAEGKVAAAQLDVAQQKVAFDLEGKVSGETDLRTKVEKGDDYGMRGVSSIGKEVGEQYAALTEWMVGKTTAEVSGMATYKRDDNHTAVPDVEELKASCTVTVGDYLAAFDKAVANAK